MAYRLDPRGALDEELRRVAGEEIAAAQAALGGGAADGKAIHAARTSFKNLRGLLRLARPTLGHAYGRENERWREAAHRLSDLRDAAVVVDTFDALRAAFAQHLREDAFEGVRARLVERREGTVASDPDVAERIRATLDDLKRGDELLALLPLPDDFKSVAAGLERVYRRARDAMRQARRSGEETAFHDWRKDAKYHWMHVRLLRDGWSEPSGKRRKRLKRLTDDLGDEHDLSVLRAVALGEAGMVEPGGERDLLAALVDRRQAVLRRSALDAGARLFAEKPCALTRETEAGWKAARAGEARNGHT